MMKPGMNKMAGNEMVNDHLCRTQPDYVTRITDDLGEARRLLTEAGVDRETVDKAIQSEQASRWGGQR